MNISPSGMVDIDPLVIAPHTFLHYKEGLSCRDPWKRLVAYRGFPKLLNRAYGEVTRHVVCESELAVALAPS